MTNRRKFFKLAGAGIAGVAIANNLYSAPKPKSSEKKQDLFKLGMAGYTMRGTTVEETFDYLNRIQVTNLSVKDFHLPMNSTQEQIDEFMAKAKAAGINIYTLGVIYMTSDELVHQAFDYAKKAGVNMIVGVPGYEQLALAEQKVKETNIRLAIHNHGPEDKLYPSPDDVYNRIKDMDKRMGLCIDIGHTMRNGTDPSVAIEKFIDRTYDIHIKDVDNNTKEGKTIEIGRGIIDIPKFISTLRKVKYSGMCSIEFEKDKNHVITGVAESIGYFKGVMASLK